MFTEGFTWYYIFCSFFSFLMNRVIGRGIQMGMYAQLVMQPIAILCDAACLVFLILGFWFMPAWWYPLALFGLSWLASLLPIPDIIGALIGIIAAPIFGVLMYLDLFGVI